MRTFKKSELDALRESLSSKLSQKRLEHVLAVERCAKRIADVYLPGRAAADTLSCAALLHDITKEYTTEEHLRVLAGAGIIPSRVELDAPKTLHAMSAEVLIKKEYPGFADPDVLLAVRWHTTGRAGMTMPEKIIYLSDYIDDSRRWPECVRLREEFFGAHPEKMTESERLKHLRRVMIDSFDVTFRSLIEDGLPVHPASNEARNSLLAEEKSDLPNRKAD